MNEVTLLDEGRRHWHSNYQLNFRVGLYFHLGEMFAIGFLFVSILLSVTAFHGCKWSHQSISTASSAKSTTSARVFQKKVTSLFSTEGGDAFSSGSVVSRCTQKITDSLNPTECVVTSSDSDPNGSHVINDSALYYYIIALRAVLSEFPHIL